MDLRKRKIEEDKNRDLYTPNNEELNSNQNPASVLDPSTSREIPVPENPCDDCKNPNRRNFICKKLVANIYCNPKFGIIPGPGPKPNLLWQKLIEKIMKVIWPMYDIYWPNDNDTTTKIHKRWISLIKDINRFKNGKDKTYYQKINCGKFIDLYECEQIKNMFRLNSL